MNRGIFIQEKVIYFYHDDNLTVLIVPKATYADIFINQQQSLKLKDRINHNGL